MKSLLRMLVGVLLGVSATLLGVFLYGLLADLHLLKAPELPGGQAAVITHIAGPVFVIRGIETLDAVPGERLGPGDVVKVTEGAVAQVQMANKGSALLGSDTLVRFMRLTGADRQLEMRTEILTGSLSYKVEKLAGGESLIIEADDVEYEVRGTDFLIVKGADGTVLAVSEGIVNVRGNIPGGESDVGGEQQLVIRPGEERAEPESLTEENRALLAASRPLPSMPFGYDDAPKPVLIEIVTAPPDSHIYVDGLKTGIGRFRGLLPEGTVIDVRVRRRGFLDYSLDVTADSDRLIEIKLNPANIEETLTEEKDDDTLLARLRADYQRRLADLRGRLSERDEEEARIAAERAENAAALEMVRDELDSSRAENERLKELIRQIQELTE